MTGRQLCAQWGSESRTLEHRKLLNTGPIIKWLTKFRPMQWGSEYRTSLVFEWLKVERLPNGLVFECHLNARLPFESRQLKVCYSDVSVI